MKCRLPTRSSRSLCRSKRPRTRSGPSGYWTNVKIGSRESPLAGPLISHLAWGVPRCPSWLRELSEVCDEMCIQGEQASKGSHSRTFKNIQLPGLASQTTKGSRPSAAVGIIPASAGLHENGFRPARALTRRWSNPKPSDP